MPADPWVGTWRPHRPRMAIAAMYNSPGPKYLLRGNTGYNDHDTTRLRAPAYSMAKRLPGLKDSNTPAPRTLPEKMTHHGKDTVPAWTMAHRQKDFDPSRTPGPAKYKTYEADRLVHPSVPAYSIALRTVGFKADDGPGPARYKDVQVFGPKIPHLKAAPAYSMSQKTTFGSMLSNIVKTPGPCAYKHVDTDVFKTRAPKYTIVERNLIPADSTMKPGPNRYRTEDPQTVRGRNQSAPPTPPFSAAHGPEQEAQGSVQTGSHLNTHGELPTPDGEKQFRATCLTGSGPRVTVHKTSQPKYTFGIHHSEFLSPLIVAPSD